MKKIIFVVVIGLLYGCQYGTDRLKSFVDDPPSLLRDPHFAQYQQQVDDLEKEYLHKEITYDEYIKRKKRIDDTYSQEVKDREDVIQNYRSDLTSDSL